MPSNSTYACINCRYAAKQTAKCPHCHSPMRNIGNAFKPPRRSNLAQWRKIAMMTEHSAYFAYCSCHRRFSPTNISDVKAKFRTRRTHKRNYSVVTDVRGEQIRRRKAWKAEV